jgi:hypothetical protein
MAAATIVAALPRLVPDGAKCDVYGVAMATAVSGSENEAAS